MDIKIKWNKPINQIAEDALGGDETLRYMANQAALYMDKYVPMEAGMLADSPHTYVKDGHGVVEYPGPYAHYQYEGRAMVGPNGSAWAKQGEIKHYNGKMLNYSKEAHSKATSHWDKAMLAERGKDFARAVQAFIKRKNGK